MPSPTPPPSQQCPEAFVHAVYQAATEVGWRLGEMAPEGPVFRDDAGVDHRIVLAEFFKRFHAFDPSEWLARVAEHYRSIIATVVLRHKNDLKVQADRLLVRIGQLPPRVAPTTFWFEPLLQTNLTIMLVIEESRGLRLVREELVKSSGLPGSHWYRRGLDNLAKRTPPGALQALEGESGLLACQVGDGHDASRALLLESLIPEPAPHGVLASIPQRDCLLALPLNRKALVQSALIALKKTTQQKHSESKRPMSSDTYWVKDGVWRRFELEMGWDSIQIKPPLECVDVLKDILGTDRGGPPPS
jgi:hypothetical protein